MSYRQLTPRPLNATLSALLKRGAHLGVGVGAFAPVLALANPTGGQVVAGQATIATPSKNGMVIDQSSQSAVINWQQFNIGKGQYVQFIQPSSSSVVLNRVVGGTPSLILGSLKANGQVFLVNANGVFFGKTAVLDVQGILASTLNIDNSSFMSGNYLFDQPGAAGATVVNQGHIRAHNGGYVVLAGDYSQNSGIITAQSGHIILASGTKATLSLNGNNLVNFAVNQATLANYAGVENSGSLIADGGTVIMTADVANALKATVVNNTGLIEAHAMSAEGGHIYLTATGGNIQNSGTLDANATRVGQAGGDIVLKGDEVTSLTQTSNITATGDGARGGTLEISGNTINVRGSAKFGEGGEILLDPTSVEIVNGGANTNHTGTSAGVNGSIGVAFIETQLNAGATVAISAHHLIHAAGSVTSIAATTGNAALGKLKLKTAAGGQINLSGVNINIAGNFGATMGYGTFGYVQAGVVDLLASSYVRLPQAVVNGQGVITRESAKSTVGHLKIIANQLFIGGGSGEDGLGLLAKGSLNVNAKIGTSFSSGAIAGNVTLVGKNMDIVQAIHATGKVTATASDGYALFNGGIHAGESIALSATGPGASGTGMQVGSLILADNGNVTITESKAQLDVREVKAAHGNVTITDTTGHVSTGRVLASNGKLSIDAGANSFFMGSGEIGDSDLVGQGGVTLTASEIKTPVSTLKIVASAGAITVKGLFGTTAEGLGHGLDLIAKDKITLDHSVKASGVEIQGSALVYTGAGKSFSIAATHSDLSLDAPIGTAAAPVKYNVNLTDYGGGIFIKKSIYVGSTAGKAAANITATQHHVSSGASLQGVLVGSNSGQPLTLSAKGDITLAGANVAIGSVFQGSTHFTSHEDVGAVTLKAGKDVSLTDNATPNTASGSHVGFMGIVGGLIISAKTTDRSTLIQAGGNIDITGFKVHIRGGAGIGSDGGTQKAVTVTANTSLIAGGSIDISGGTKGSVQLAGGTAGAFVLADSRSKGTYTAVAEAQLNLTAGTTLEVKGGHGVGVSYGDENASAQAGKNVTAEATADAGVNLKAASVSLSGTGEGGVSIGGSRHGVPKAYASGSHAKAVTKVNSDIDITATGSIDIVGHGVSLRGGHSIGRSGVAVAAGHSAAASLAVSGGLNLTAGKAGISIIGASGNAIVQAGKDAGSSMAVSAASHAKATATVTAGVSLITTGGITLGAASSAKLQGGSSAGKDATVTANSGKAALTVADGLSLKAATLNIITSSSARISGGYGAGFQAGVAARQAGSAAMHASADAVITLSGAFKASASGELVVAGGSAGAKGASVLASHAGDKATLTEAASVHISAKSVQMSAGLTAVVGGQNEAAYAVAADKGGAATLTADGSVSLTAVTGITLGLVSGGTLVVAGGNSAAGAARAITGQNGKAGVTALAGVSLTTTGSGAGIKLTTNGHPGVIIVAAGAKGLTTYHHSSAAYASVGLGGGAASIAADASVTLNAKGALTLSAGNADHSGFAVIIGGASEGMSAVAFAGKGGKAAVSATGDVNLTGTAVTLTAGGASANGNLFIDAGGKSDAAQAQAFGRFGGAATATIASAVTITAGGAFTATAGHEIGIGGGTPSGSQVSAGARAEVVASHSGAQAAMTVTDTVAIKATSVSLTADSGFVHIVGANCMACGAGVAAVAKNDKASLTGAGGISITATTGAISITAKGIAGSPTNSHHLGDIGISAGGAGGVSASISAGNPLASATLKLDAGVNLTAKTGFTADASETIQVHGGGFLGAGESIVAFGKGAKVSLGDTADVNITAATIGVFAGNDLAIAQGSDLGASWQGKASHSGQVAATLDASVNLNAKTGAMSIAATDGRLVAGLPGGSVGFEKASADGHGVINLSVSDNLSLTAGGSLHLFGNSGLTVAGAHGLAASAAAQSGGSATVKLSGTVAVKAGKKLVLKTFGSMSLHGGDLNEVVANLFEGPSSHSSGSIPVTVKPGGKITGAFATGLSLTAGSDVDISAGANVTARAGSLELLAVGAARVGSGYVGEAWAGGTATLSGDDGITVTAGHNLNIAAGLSGSGSIDVEGTRSHDPSFHNFATVRGGSSNAVAKLTLTGNAVLSAKNDVTLTAAAGNASVVGGSFSDLRADHASGNVTILGSADATIHAGHDVVLTLGGSLTVAGVGINSSHGGFVSVAADANEGVANVTGHADASISAVNDIRTVGSIGGLNVVGGEFVLAAALGNAASEHAVATANATLSAGNIAISGAGDLNVLGGLYDSVGAVALGSSVRSLNADLQAKATITAKKALTLSLKGDGVIAGGDSLGAFAVVLSSSGSATGLASGDVSATIKGATVSLAVGGDLLLRGGSGVFAAAVASGGAIKATANANAGATIAATGNLTLTVGTGASGTASIVGGSGGRVIARDFRSDNVAAATAHADVTLTAKKALSLNVAGALKIVGGPGAEPGSSGSGQVLDGNSSTVPAFNGTATGTLSGKVLITAGTNLTVQAGKTITILGGSHAGSFAAVSAAAGSSDAVGKDAAALSVDDSVVMKATAGTLRVTSALGGSNVNITTTLPSSSSAIPFVGQQGVSVTASAKFNESVTLTGKTVNVGAGTRTCSSCTIDSNGLSYNATIRVGANLTTAFKPLSLPPVSGSRGVEGGVRLSPHAGESSFGLLRGLDPGTSLLLAPSSSTAPMAGGVQLSSQPLSLGLLQTSSLVTSLQPLLAPPAASPPMFTLYNPPDPGGSPESALGGTCRALVVKPDDHDRCQGGNP